MHRLCIFHVKACPQHAAGLQIFSSLTGISHSLPEDDSCLSKFPASNCQNATDGNISAALDIKACRVLHALQPRLHGCGACWDVSIECGFTAIFFLAAALIAVAQRCEAFALLHLIPLFEFPRSVSSCASPTHPPLFPFSCLLCSSRAA